MTKNFLLVSIGVLEGKYLYMAAVLIHGCFRSSSIQKASQGRPGKVGPVQKQKLTIHYLSRGLLFMEAAPWI